MLLPQDFRHGQRASAYLSVAVRLRSIRMSLDFLHDLFLSILTMFKRICNLLFGHTEQNPEAEPCVVCWHIVAPADTGANCLNTSCHIVCHVPCMASWLERAYLCRLCQTQLSEPNLVVEQHLADHNPRAEGQAYLEATTLRITNINLAVPGTKSSSANCARSLVQ